MMSWVEMAREKVAVGGRPEIDAHNTAQPNSSDDTNLDCSNVTVPGAVCMYDKQCMYI